MIFGQESALAFDLLERGDVLHELEGAEIALLLVAEGKEADVQVFVFHVDPELRHIAGARAEIAENAIDEVDAVDWMAVLHLAADNGSAARKDALRAFRKERDAVVGIDECKVEGHGRKDCL